ncbi:MAG: DISARM system helicase DrmA, partial [Planctomycetota bacterium]|nr:DISARM system helicase DrmA [Planctomycetota bacterium]
FLEKHYDDDNPPEQSSARKAFFPSSMGLSVLLSAETKTIEAKVTWGDYHFTFKADEGEDGDKGPDESQRTKRIWQRSPKEASLTLPIQERSLPARFEIPGTEGLQFVVSVRTTSGAHLPVGTRSVSIFLVNNRRPELQRSEADAAAIFQPELSLMAPGCFVPRTNMRGHESDDWDDKVADLQYRDCFEYAVGHNVSAVAFTNKDGQCDEVRTSWMPTAQVEKVVPSKIKGAEFGMFALAEIESAPVLDAMMAPIISEYEEWIDKQQVPQDANRAEVTESLLRNAQRAKVRIKAGLDTLQDPMMLAAFRLTNKVIATAICQRAPTVTAPKWHPFQLAFLLMNLPAIGDPTSADRNIVDLLFIPTVGGKTEAYLGLAAFTMILRRFKDPSIHSSGLSVIMRYTLRLLTLDQLGRAATLICAMELERQNDVVSLGRWPFEIGLWVGQSATPNRMGVKGKDNEYSARRRTLAFMDDDRQKPSPIPLENCPWCNSKFTKNSFQLLPAPDKPTDLRIFCTNRRCEFHPRKQNQGLPIIAVDEPIYRRLPSFIIATVDKFANLPWVGETAGLFGKVSRYDSEGFYGPSHKGVGQNLDRPLPPPDLIIQDELHLISGPLGTMVGLYETAIDALCQSPDKVRPKIVASTATVRRAEKQIRALFGRDEVNIFPPPGPDRRDSFFAHTVSATTKNPRTYLGISAQGRNAKVVLLRTYVALLSAAQKAWKDNGGAKVDPNPADPYMTVLGYFGSLRELGGSRRIVEDEVRSRLGDYGRRRRRIGQKTVLFANRKRLNGPEELTSRVSTNKVAETKRRLGVTFHNEKESLDVALATNMISVGLDISRLGLMVVLGQPKSTSEYIQATSRVGRDDT